MKYYQRLMQPAHGLWPDRYERDLGRQALFFQKVMPTAVRNTPKSVNNKPPTTLLTNIKVDISIIPKIKDHQQKQSHLSFPMYFRVIFLHIF